MILLVPCAPNGAALWTQRTPLDGTDYVLTFDWHQRVGRGVLHLADADGVPIRTGMVLNLGTALLGGSLDPRRPPGELVVVDATGARDVDPGFGDLGSRFLLAYADRAELGR